MRFVDRTGQKYGMLTAEYWRKKQNRVWWYCLCDCGKSLWVIGTNLREQGGTRSCGCSRNGNPSHGLSKTPEYSIWKGMRKRCNNPKEPVYKYYGGKGIRVCKRWDRFENFLEDMGLRPSKKHSIDRKDSTKNYCPSNCRWATTVEQRRNRVDSIRLTYRGQTLTPIEWAVKLDIPYSALRARVTRGFSITRILQVGDLRADRR